MNQRIVLRIAAILQIVLATADSAQGAGGLAFNGTDSTKSRPPAISPSKKPCVRPIGGVKCASGPSTLIVVIAGMCAMMLLVLIAILLLFFSHFRYRQRLRALQELSYRQNIAADASISHCSNQTDSQNPCEGIVLVLLPGAKHVSSCAKPCPLFTDTSSNACDAKSEFDSKEKTCNC
ncbi:hypothetical protein KP509_14G072700 [Ceratopteris richardii]|uniref:Uncharacterized protein n=1 Tax=Ceratopteris richardii TaxID=49495 RepID=A0A8T2TAS2_CERRI|nr:hypothetical protein KP509_14G072700 [Ceratopteris richardii]